MPADRTRKTITTTEALKAADQARRDALAAQLSYVSPDQPGIARRRSGRGFTYRNPDGATVRDAGTLARIHALVIPPAWNDVWICARANGHLQAVGVDQRGRRQYRYHPRFRAVRDEAKFEHVLAFAEGLPALRARIAEDMARPGLGRDKVLATVAHLLETTMIRVGNEAYAKENGSFGLATLRNRHVKIEGGALAFRFKGKSGKEWRVGVQDRRVARIVRACQDLPGQHLFQYLDDAGERQAVSSADVNEYLKAASGREITAKDFRTWWGTVLAALALAAEPPPDSDTEAKRQLTQAVKQVAHRLGNTPTVCRKCYIHPEVPAAHRAGALRLDAPRGMGEGLSPEESAVLALLRARLDHSRSTDGRAAA
jgi:DNA topoisomerase I